MSSMQHLPIAWPEKSLDISATGFLGADQEYRKLFSVDSDVHTRSRKSESRRVLRLKLELLSVAPNSYVEKCD